MSSSISQIVALHRRAAQVATAPLAVGRHGSAVGVSATVTLGVARPPLTYSAKAKRPPTDGSEVVDNETTADSAETSEADPPPADNTTPAGRAAARLWRDTPAPGARTPPLDATA